MMKDHKPDSSQHQEGKKDIKIKLCSKRMGDMVKHAFLSFATNIQKIKKKETGGN